MHGGKTLSSWKLPRLRRERRGVLIVAGAFFPSSFFFLSFFFLFSLPSFATLPRAKDESLRLLSKLEMWGCFLHK